VTEGQRWALVSYIAHLTTEDWEALAFDLRELGFIPEGVSGC
jgi:aarF domain-containing kinase